MRLVLAVAAGAAVGLAGVLTAWLTGAFVLLDRSPPHAPPGPYRVATRDHALSSPDGSDASLPSVIHVRLWFPEVSASEASSPVTSSRPDRSAVGIEATFPIIVFVPAWGGHKWECSLIARSLASRGFVVAGIDDVLHDAPARKTSPDDEAARASTGDFSSEASQAASLQEAERRVQLAVRKVAATLDRLERSRETVFGSPLAARVSFHRIGLLGNSLGGAAAAETSHADTRVRAVVNMDGWLFGNAARNGLDAPYLILNSTLPDFGQADLEARSSLRRFMARMAFEDRSRQARQAARPDTVRLAIAGSVHPDFSDGVFRADRWHDWRPWRGPLIAPQRMQTIVETYVGAFFERHLSGAARPLLDSNPSPFPEVRVLGTEP